MAEWVRRSSPVGCIQAVLILGALTATVACSLATDLDGFTSQTSLGPDSGTAAGADGGPIGGPIVEGGAPDASTTQLTCVPPSFCDSFDGPVFDPAWERANEGGALRLDTSSARSAPGSLLLELPSNPDNKQRRAVLRRGGFSPAARLRCRFAFNVEDVVGPDSAADIQTFKIGQLHPKLNDQSFGIEITRSRVTLFERGTGDSYNVEELGALTLRTWITIELDTDFKTLSVAIDGKPVLTGEKIEEVVYDSFYVEIGATEDTDDAAWTARYDDLSCEITPLK